MFNKKFRMKVCWKHERDYGRHSIEYCLPLIDIYQGK